MAKMKTTLSLSFMRGLSQTMDLRAWKMCAPVVMGVILSDILVIITTTIMVTIFLKSMLPCGQYLLHGRSDRAQGVHTLTRRAACSHGAEGRMGNFALAHDDLQRLYPTLLEIGSGAINALFPALSYLACFYFRALHLAFLQHTLPDNGLRYIML
jgi:hypothetical protein